MVKINGVEVAMEVAANLMDEEISEQLQRDLPEEASEQEFADAYVAAHRDKFDEEFRLA